MYVDIIVGCYYLNFLKSFYFKRVCGHIYLYEIQFHVMHEKYRSRPSFKVMNNHEMKTFMIRVRVNIDLSLVLK